MLKKCNVWTFICCIILLVSHSAAARGAAGLSIAAPGSSTAKPVLIITIGVATIEATCGNNNGTIIVTATGGSAPYMYSIDGTTFQLSNTFLNVGPNTYTVTVKDATLASNTTMAAISNLPGPTFGSASSKAASCANNDGNISISGAGGTAPYTYSVDGTHFQPTGNFSGLDSGKYTVTIKDVNGCLNDQSIIVPLINDLSLAAGKDTTICEGSSASLHAASNGASFSWTPAAGLTGGSSLNAKASPVLTTKYYITAGLGVCQKKDSTLVTVNTAPVANAGSDTSICFGKSVQLSGSGGQSYSWSPDTYLDNTAISDPLAGNPTSTITYHLVVTDANGCQSLQSALVTVTVIPPPKLFAGNDTSVLANQPVQLHATDVDNSGFTQYTWSPSTGLNDPSTPDPIADLVASATYRVTGMLANGCISTASVTINIFTISDLYVPNAFTPNGDGHNDILRVIPVSIRELSYFAVFNRSGQRIFFTTDPGMGWDGTLNGRPQDPGIYVWMTGGVDYKGVRVARKGTVMLIR